MQEIKTNRAPTAIGPYSQAVKTGTAVYFSGQIPLDPTTSKLIEGDIQKQAKQVFENLKAVAEAAGGELQHIVRIGIYLMDLSHFDEVNKVMASYFKPPYPARSTIQVSGLPKGALIEVDAIMSLSK